MPVHTVVEEIMVAAREERIEELTRQVEELREALEALTEKITVDDQDQLTIRSTSILLEADSALRLSAAAAMEISASATFVVTAANMSVNAPMARYSGVVQCTTIIANSVVSASYTPGAGNVW